MNTSPLRLLAVACLTLLASGGAAAPKPAVWIYTDMSDKTIPGKNHMGTVNDPDDISAMAGYLLLANEFDTRGIVVASTHRNEHATTPDQAVWADETFGAAYRAEVARLNRALGGGFPADIQFVESCIKRTAERYDTNKTYSSLDRHPTVQALFEEVLREPAGGLINVLCWGSLTEPAIFVNHCLATGQTTQLEKVRFIAHWTNSPLHQGTAEHPEHVANCREDAAACAYLKQCAQQGLIDYRELGAIGQHGIVSGAPRGATYYEQFKVSRLGRLFAEGKFVNDSVDHSDSATYWVLLGTMGVTLDDIPRDGSNSAATEQANEGKFREHARALHEELLRRARSAASPADAIAAHDRAVHIHDHWIRDPYIVLGPNGWYYLTGTTLKNEPDAVVGIPVWRSRDLANWEQLPRLWALADSSWMGDIRPDSPRPATQGADFKALGVGTPDTLVWAPELHFIDSRWVIVHTTNARQANLLLSAGPELSGPLTEPMGAAFGHRHDPSLFLADDGTPWVVWGVLSLQPLKRDLSGYAGPQIDLKPADRKMGHEGSVIRKIGSKYVWFGTAWSTDILRKGTYNLYYCTADALTGPYGPRRFAGRFLGHGTPFQDKQGHWWCTAFFNANNPPIADSQAHDAFSSDAYTINAQGTTIVPLDVSIASDGEVVVRALDPRYALPGPEEVQVFPSLP